MGKFFAPNITTSGRIARAVWGVLLIVVAIIFFSRSHIASCLLAVAGVFALYESLLGWCVLRACGIKTKM
jgi:hypothetical protein